MFQQRNVEKMNIKSHVEVRRFKKQPLTKSEEYDVIQRINLFAKAQLDQQCSKLFIVSFPINISGKLFINWCRNLCGRESKGGCGEVLSDVSDVWEINIDRRVTRERTETREYINGFCVRPVVLYHTFTVCTTYMTQSAQGQRTVHFAVFVILLSSFKLLLPESAFCLLIYPVPCCS